jgi:hypothetical protein
MKKRLALVTILCILWNSALAAGSVAQQAPVVRPPAVQPAAQKVMATADQPFTALSALAKTGTPLLPEYRTCPISNDAGDHTLSSLSLAPDCRQKMIRSFKTGDRSAGSICLPGTVGAWSALSAVHRRSRDHTAIPLFIILFALSYLVVLSKSNLPWGMAQLSLLSVYPAGRQKPGFFIEELS